MDKALDNFRVRFEHTERELELVNKLLDRNVVKAVIHVFERDRKALFAFLVLVKRIFTILVRLGYLLGYFGNFREELLL